MPIVKLMWHTIEFVAFMVVVTELWITFFHAL